MKKIFDIAKRDSKQVHALITLLHTCALRMQDVIGLTFGEVVSIKPNQDGFRKLILVAKKSSSRTVMIDQEAVNIILAY